MPTTSEIQCLKCSAQGTKSVSGMMMDLPDGWMEFQGTSNSALNREVHLCANCGKSVPMKRSMLASVG